MLRGVHEDTEGVNETGQHQVVVAQQVQVPLHSAIMHIIKALMNMQNNNNNVQNQRQKQKH